MCLRERIMKKIPTARPLLIFLCTAIFSFFPKFSTALTTITSTQFIRDDQDAETLVSEGEIFELGFFNPSTSTKNRYLGIWYKNISARTVVWVANRQNPLNDSTSTLKIGDDGNLVLINGLATPIWSTNLSKADHPVVQLTESGNLVLKEESDGHVLWQSFDHPSDTLLPGMKLGWDLKTGLNRFLTSWKSTDDPSPGDFTFKLDIHGSPQLIISHGSELEYRTGPWNGIRFSGLPQMGTNKIFSFNFVDNKDEIYYSFEVVNSSYLSRVVMNSSGHFQRYALLDREDATWNLFWGAPRDDCDYYSTCGPYGICNADNSPLCSCAHGFQPKLPQEWFLRDASGGCVRRTALNCSNGVGFLKLEGMKLPDTANAFVNRSISLKECKDECLNNCSCMAYAAANISSGGEGSGCTIWNSDLIDLRQYTVTGQDLYIRLVASDLGTDSFNKRRRLPIVLSSLAAAAMLLAFGYFLWSRHKKHGRRAETRESYSGNWVNHEKQYKSFNMIQSDRNTTEVPLISFDLIVAATNNFSTASKLGEGGFGPVYKGKLPTGQEIAVKKLSTSSHQGLEEFKNEVELIAKLQHKNLVRLLGWCIHGEEKMLIYEYMPNSSLDKLLFDTNKQSLLDWGKRFRIVEGIAQGLLYLHLYSRVKVIHRDLKASNILLDIEMNPKISDFGLARIFGGNQTEANTERVVGTYGYMSPEYALGGLFSEKSDVFSFGVLLLEIVTSKRSNIFYLDKRWSNLQGLAWQLWSEGKGLELMDPSISNSFVAYQVDRCIHVGLLCVQEDPSDRPTMSSVVSMLGNASIKPPSPKKPAFSMWKSPIATDPSISSSVNEATISVLEART